MGFAKVHSAQPVLLNAHLVSVEADVSPGLFAFSIVGLPDKAVEEARDRVAAAIKNSGFKSPKQKNNKVIISLAPASLKKEGPAFDVPIALSYLLATKDISFSPEKRLFLGELALDGSIRPIAGVLPAVREAEKNGFTEIYIPKENIEEASLIKNITLFPVSSLAALTNHLSGKSPLTPYTQTRSPRYTEQHEPWYDLSEIRGQEHAKRGLLIAAAGGHNVAMYGPPGTGKTMLARAFIGLLPPLSLEDILDVTSIHSVAGALHNTLITHPPLRTPHHTASYVSLVGGGTTVKPGEVTLAHKGVLFLDEFPEFERRVIDALRQPLEDRVISISRAKGSATFPADFILIAAMNPCPCGNFGTKGKECTCSAAAISRYKSKLSGPIVDRIDLWLEVGPIDHALLLENTSTQKESVRMRKQVIQARIKQYERAKKYGLARAANAGLKAKDLHVALMITNKAKDTLNTIATKLNLSARAYHRIAKLGRTIADLEGSEPLLPEHLLEAAQYRPKQ